MTWSDDKWERERQIEELDALIDAATERRRRRIRAERLAWEQEDDEEGEGLLTIGQWLEIFAAEEADTQREKKQDEPIRNTRRVRNRTGSAFMPRGWRRSND